MSKRWNTGGGGFLLNPPAPAAHATSFEGLDGIDGGGLSGCPQTALPPCFRLHVHGNRTDNIGAGLDTFLPGTWLLTQGYAEPLNFYFYVENFPIYIASVKGSDPSFDIRWILYHGRPNVEAGPYWVPGAENSYPEGWYLVGMPGESSYGAAPHRIYRLWGVENQDPDLEPIPVPPNDLIGEPPYNDENDDWFGYQNEKDFRHVRNFREIGNDDVLDPLGSNWFRIETPFDMLERDARILGRADNEHLRLEAYWP